MRKTKGRFHILMCEWALLALATSALACAAPGMGGYPARTSEEKFAVQTVNDMADALNNGDVQRFMSRISSGFYRGYGQLEKRVASTLADRRNLKVEARVTEVQVEDAKFLVTVAWRSSWVSRATGLPDALEGSTRLSFISGMGLKLLDHSGELLLGF